MHWFQSAIEECWRQTSVDFSESWAHVQ